MEKDILSLKRMQLEKVAEQRDHLRLQPRLRWLFFEITNRCNLRCRHCGSNCTSVGQTLSIEDVNNTLNTIQGEKPMICLTGGEPMLHPRFYEIAQSVKHLGFYWGMTTNATLIDETAAKALRRAGLSTVSVSLDGMEPSHNALRRNKGAWKQALRGLRYLQDAGFNPQVTTVVHMDNYMDLDPLYDLLCRMGIGSWRIINVEPIGRACESDGMMLTPTRLKELLRYIQEKRFDRSCPMEVTFGCSHYLGTVKERMVRDHYFLCGAGILTASIRSNGNICACLDVENRSELVQGNIRSDDFWEVWNKQFKAFRMDRTALSKQCSNCSERFICGGDSAHTWNYDLNEPLLCVWEILTSPECVNS